MTAAKPYGAGYTVQKSDCIRHIQRKMGSSLRSKKNNTIRRNSQMDGLLAVPGD